MKWFLIFLAIGLVDSEKLDRTYLPPPGAQFSGGNLGDRDVPLAPPNHSHSGLLTTGHEVSPINFGLSGEPGNFGDKIPKVAVSNYPEKVPTTTTSYAFTQTTTFPPAENYETTALPINPVTGLPVNLGQGNYPYGSPGGLQDAQTLPNYAQNQGQRGIPYGSNFQPDLSSTTAPATYDSSSYSQSGNQPLNQYLGQNIPGGSVQIPGSVYTTTNQNKTPIQYSGEQGNTEQQGISATDVPSSKNFENYPGQNLVNPESAVIIPSGNQNSIQYPYEQLTGQQGFVSSTNFPSNIQPGDNQYDVKNDGSQGPQLNQGSYQNQVPQNMEGTRSQQYSSRNPNIIIPESGLTSSTTIPSLYYNDASGTTAAPGFPSSTSAYSSVTPVYRPERPQAAADRNAVILNYENVRTPNSYSYSYDTSNGIHADESGVVDNGTKAQGAYSYIGDDGKVYSVIYTADENGFQPRGDHLPTPPPIPEAIKKVIEQAVRDKEAGIVDDGSYDAAKYGDKKYRGPANRRPSQKLNSNQVRNKPLNEDQIKPIAGINDSEYDEGISQDQYISDLPVTKTRQQGSNNNIPSRTAYQINEKSNGKNISEGNSPLIGNYAQTNENGAPIIKDGINEIANYGTKKQVSSVGGPIFSEDNLPYAKDANQNNQFGEKSSLPSRRRPIGVAKDMNTKYSEFQTDGDGTDYPKTGRDRYYEGERQNMDSGSPSVFDGSGEIIDTKYDSATGSPIKSKQFLKPRVQGNRRPSIKSTAHSKNVRPGNVYSKETDTPSISDYIKNAVKQPASNEQTTRQDESGYHYQPPNTKFEQTKFPTRFNTQKISSDSYPDQGRTEFNRGTTRKPFITPNVYSQNVETQPSTTRRPFTTIGVTSPMDSSYTDYDESDDYGTDQDIDDEGIDSSKDPNKKNDSAYRPHQETSTKLKPQYTPDLSVQRTRVTQKDSVNPGDQIENSGTLTPGYRLSSTTPMPTHTSRFGSTEKSRTPQHGLPSSTIHDSSTAVGRPAFTKIPSKTSNYKYQTTRPISKYHSTSGVPGYPPTGITTGLVSSTPGLSVPKSYTTSTYGPSQGYSNVTPVPSISGYNPEFGSQIPSSTPVVYQTPGSYHTGYHYGPPKSDYSVNVLPNTFSPDLGFYTPYGTPGKSSIYQTYQQGRDGFPSTTSVPKTSGKSDPYIQSQQGNIAPASSPIGTYQGNLQNIPSTSNFFSTTVASTPGGRPVIGYPEPSTSPNFQNVNGYEYGPSSPSYSATDMPSTVRTTSGSFISPAVPTQGYSTTYSPGFQTTKDSFISGPVVDGFGRPITVDQGGSHLGFDQGTKGPIDSEGPKFVVTEKSTAYPYDQSTVIGEDFSGPKQPQRYDPETGYHY